MSSQDDKSLVDRVVDRLVTAIAIGEFVPGERLPAERDLAAVLGVGRTTVRAALDVLLDGGLLLKQRGRTGGSFVTQDWPEDAVEQVARWFDEQWPTLVDASVASTRLHGAICRLAAENRTDDDVALLRDALASFRAAKTGAPKQRADSLLHLRIIEAAHNDSLAELLLAHERRLSIVAPAHPWGETELHDSMEARASREHGELVDAIAERRVEDAGRIAQHHVEIDLEMLRHARDRAWARRAEAGATVAQGAR